MLLNLEAPVPQQTKGKFVNLSVFKKFQNFKNFIRFQNFKKYFKNFSFHKISKF